MCATKLHQECGLSVLSVFTYNHGSYGTNPTWDKHNGHNRVVSAAEDFAY